MAATSRNQNSGPSLLLFFFSLRLAKMAGSSASAIPELTPAGFDEYNAQLQAAALQATRHGVSLPTPSDLSFHRSLDRTFSKELDACSSRVLSLTNKLISLVSASSKSNGGNNKGKSRKLESEDDVVDHFHALVVDRMDELLEQAVRNAFLDIYI